VTIPPLEPYSAIADRINELYRAGGEEAAEAYHSTLDDETQKWVFFCMCEELSHADREELFEEMKRMALEEGIEIPE
jgi:hypothetical protein